MISKNAVRIKESLESAKKISKYASMSFRVIMIGYILVQTIFFCSSVFAFASSSIASSDLIWVVLRLLTMSLSIVAGILIFAALMQVFGNISTGNSPFTIKQARILSLIGWFLVADAILVALISMTPLPEMKIGILTLGLESPRLDLTSIIGAIVFFCFSYTFKYGSLLQQLSDDTV
jgi:hypothetical protein